MAIKPDLKPAFLAALRQVPVVQHACDAIGIGRTTAYGWRNEDKDFAAAWDDAMEAGIDRAEAEAFRRAVIGFDEPVVHKGVMSYRTERHLEGDEVAYRTVLDDRGQPVPLTVRKHSDMLLSLVLKGRRKQVFAERTELTGADGKDLTPVDETARAARIAQLMAAASSRRNAPADGSDLV